MASLSITNYIGMIQTDGGTAGSATSMGYTSTPAQITKTSGATCNGTVNAPSGPLDDMRIYNRVLAPWEMSQIMWQGLQGHR